VTVKEEMVARLWGRGYTNAEIASRVKIGGRQVQRCKKNPAVQALAQRIREQTDPSAVDVLRELLTSRSETVRLQAARTLLLTPIAAEEPEEDDDGAPRITVLARPEEAR
jgi:HEAT repeat protein